MGAEAFNWNTTWVDVRYVNWCWFMQCPESKQTDLKMELITPSLAAYHIIPPSVSLETTINVLLILVYPKHRKQQQLAAQWAEKIVTSIPI